MYTVNEKEMLRKTAQSLVKAIDTGAPLLDIITQMITRIASIDSIRRRAEEDVEVLSKWFPEEG